MIKSISFKKGEVGFFCTSNGVSAVLLTDFQKVKTFFNGKPLDSFSSKGLTLNQVCNKLKSYSNGKR